MPIMKMVEGVKMQMMRDRWWGVAHLDCPGTGGSLGSFGSWRRAIGETKILTHALEWSALEG